MTMTVHHARYRRLHDPACLHPGTERNADVLDAAADYIERHGWCHRDAVGPDGNVCALTALIMVAPRRADGSAVSVGAPFRALTVAAGLPTSGDIVGWNDADGRTEQQVLDVFRKAAKQERQRAAGVEVPA